MLITKIWQMQTSACQPRQSRLSTPSGTEQLALHDAAVPVSGVTGCGAARLAPARLAALQARTLMQLVELLLLMSRDGAVLGGVSDAGQHVPLVHLQ
jgi:hypothetical protein